MPSIPQTPERPAPAGAIPPLPAATSDGDPTAPEARGDDARREPDAATPIWLAEANDTIAEAVDLTDPFGATGALELSGWIGDDGIGAGANDVDLIGLSMTAGQVVSAEVGAHWTWNAHVRVFDAAGRELLRDESDDMGSHSAKWEGPRVAFAAPSDGMYYFGVSSGGNATYDPTVAGSGFGGAEADDASYGLVLGAPIYDLAEGDGTLETATDLTDRFRLEAEVFARGLIGDDVAAARSADVDLARIDLAPGESLRLRVWPADLTTWWAMTPTDLRIFDAAGVEIQRAGPDWPREVVLSAEAATTLYVGVSAAGNDAYRPVTGDGAVEGAGDGEYALQVAHASFDLDERRGDPADAPDLTPLLGTEGGRLMGYVGDRIGGTGGDFDLAQIHLTAGRSVTFGVETYVRDDGYPSGLDPHLRLFDAEGHVVATGLSDYGVRDGLAFTPEADGTYFVGVGATGDDGYDPFDPDSARGGGTRGDYALSPGLLVVDLAEGDDGLCAAPDVTDRLPAAGALRLTGFVGDRAGDVASAHDVDFLRVTLAAGQALRVVGGDEWGTSYPIALRIFDTEGRALAAGASEFGRPELLFVAPAAGVYVVGASAFDNVDYDPKAPDGGAGGSRVGGYALDLSLPVFDFAEPNDTRAEAVDVTARLRATGTLEIGGYVGDLVDPDARARDVDFAAVTLAAGETLSVARSDWTTVAVYDPTGATVRAPGSAAFHDGYDTERTLFTAATAGRYVIAVGSDANVDYDPDAPGSGTDGPTGEYGVALALTAFDMDETATDIASARDVTERIRATGEATFSGYLGDTAGAVDPTSDVDLVRIRLAEGETLRLIAEGRGDYEAVDPALRLFDGSGAELRASDDASFGDTNAVLTFVSPVQADYVVGVSASGNMGYDPLDGTGGAPGRGVGDYGLHAVITQPVDGSTLFGTAGDDRIVLTTGDQFVFAGNGGDVIDGRGGPGRNYVFAGDGNDHVQAGPGDDVMGQGGNDVLFGTIDGGDWGGARLDGGANHDRLIGGFRDALFGGDGNDRLYAGASNQMTGGPGADWFHLTPQGLTNDGAWGPQTVHDFSPVGDGDVLSLAGAGLSFDRLRFVATEAAVLIRADDPKQGTPIAVLEGFAPAQLDAAFFDFG